MSFKESSFIYLLLRTLYKFSRISFSAFFLVSRICLFLQCRAIIQCSSRSSEYYEQTLQPSQRCYVATELPCVNQVLESSRGEQSSRGTSGEPWRLLRLHLCCNMGSKPARKLSSLFFLCSFHATELTRQIKMFI